MRAFGIIAILPVFLGLSANGTMAQDVISGQLDIGLARNSDASDNSKRIVAQIGFGLGERWELQFDVGVGKYEDDYSTAPHAGVHFGFELSDELTLGGFLSGDDTRPGNYFYYGVEAKYDARDMKIDAYVTGIDVVNSNTGGTRYGVDSTFDLAIIENVSVLAGVHAQSLSGDNRSYAYFGGSYTFANDMTLGLTAGLTGQKESIAGIQFTIPFGGGATFGHRDTRSVFAAY